MVKPITRLQLTEMVSREKVQIVDVLPEQEFSESHLPGAVNISLKILGPDTVSVLQIGIPTVVY